MNVVEAIYGRRAVRAYDSRQVDEANIEQLLHAAVQAPSAMNAQPWMFAIVQNKKKLSELSERAKTMLLETRADAKTARYDTLLREPGFNVFYDAGTLIAIGAAPSTYADADCWLAAEALMLAAHDAGIGTCPIGFAVGVLNAPDVKKDLGFPENAVVIAPIIVGYPSATSPPVPRAEPRIVSWVT